MALILLRHTRPADCEGLCYGRSDLALGPGFEADAAEVLRGLPRIGSVWSSPLGRCLRLAERVAAARGLGVAVDARISEMDFGAWERKAWSGIARAELDAWAADFHGARPHGGESVAMLAGRVGAALEDACGAPGPVLWVTHAGVAKAACALTGRRAGWDTRLGFGEWLELP